MDITVTDLLLMDIFYGSFVCAGRLLSIHLISLLESVNCILYGFPHALWAGFLV